MYDTYGPQADTTTAEERKPPTLADIVREKTDDGKRIVDFFLDVMEDRIDGAELCHRIDAAKQLEKHKSKAAAKFLAKYRGVSCGHSINGRPDPADPCSAEERSLVAVTLNAPATLTKDFLTVLSGIDEFLMARLIRAQTADGVTVIEFLDDVMQDRNDGFKCHHRIAAAKELIVHIVRDEQPEPTPREPVPEQSGIPAEATQRAEAPKHEWPASILWPEEYKFIHSRALENPREILARAEKDPKHPLHGYFKDYKDIRASIESVGGFLGPDGLLTTLSPPKGPTLEPAPAKAGGPAKSLPRTRYGAGTHPAHPEPGERHEANSPVIPAESLPRTRYGAGTHPRPEPAEGRQDNKVRRRRDGAARAATLEKPPSSERNNEEEKDEKPAPVELTPAERRIRERLEQHWHEPDPYGAPIDSASPARSPPW